MLFPSWLSSPSRKSKNKSRFVCQTSAKRSSASKLDVEWLEGRLVPAVLLVNKSVPADFQTIQDAVNHASTVSTDTILVAPGTYEENVIVDRTVNIFGPNSGISPNGITPHIRGDRRAGSDGNLVARLGLGHHLPRRQHFGSHRCQHQRLHHRRP